MRSDFDPILWDFQDYETMVIHPVADLHLEDPSCRLKDFEGFLRSAAERDNHHLVLLGDLLNNATKNSVSNSYESVMRPRDAKRMLTELLRPVAPRILCGVPGNHERRSAREVDENPLYDIFCKLDIEDRYREGICCCILRFGSETKDRRQLHGYERPTYVLVASHGAGGERRASGFSARWEGVDAFLYARDHRPKQRAKKRLVVDARNKRIRDANYCEVFATSWLRGEGYPLEKTLPPTPYAPNELILGGKRRFLDTTMHVF